jgi:uncharacterized membrane protein YphA (DoxX/SURF4 family)
MPSATVNDQRGANRTQTRTNIILWIIQGLLAALFLFAGGMKLMLPVAELTQQTKMPGFFIRLIGVAEVLGGIGLILPGLTRIRPSLTSLASAGLTIIMIGATIVTLDSSDIRMMPIPFVTGVLSAFVAYGRWRVAPCRARVLFPRSPVDF